MKAKAYRTLVMSVRALDGVWLNEFFYQTKNLTAAPGACVVLSNHWPARRKEAMTTSSTNTVLLRPELIEGIRKECCRFRKRGTRLKFKILIEHPDNYPQRIIWPIEFTYGIHDRQDLTGIEGDLFQ